jgi:hypothetical protein
LPFGSYHTSMTKRLFRAHFRAAIAGLSLLAAAMFCSPGCATLNNDPTVLESREQIFYYDRNADGQVDREVHHYRGVADADWELRDDDFNWRFEKKILYGVGVIESAVDIPVPTHVHIEPNR